MTIKKLFSFALFVSLCGGAFAWKVEGQAVAGNIKIDPKQPTVYISFDHVEKVEVPTVDRKGKESVSLIWLTLHNNIKADIRLCTHEGRFTPSRKPGIDYRVESLWDFSGPEPIPPTILYTFPAKDTCGRTTIRSGETFPFSVRKDVLTERSRIIVHFHYAWEDYWDVVYDKEPEHIVYIGSQSLLGLKVVWEMDRPRS
ncbi:MAG: hypothetical protein UZ17_ACD001001409 [Acidobacteria bacterium OLB17]|nr:MAG: hypothetical protein UZ17_ACD001001409 [Acidobacteria bacterium OLB17]MCZ2391792.1 hypothetical protein [Acidobacteriota bacterium]